METCCLSQIRILVYSYRFQNPEAELNSRCIGHILPMAQVADGIGRLGRSQIANGGLLRPVILPGFKGPPWFTLHPELMYRSIVTDAQMY